MRSNAELIDAVLGGDLATYAELVRRHQRLVLATAWQTLGDYHAAEDAAQEAFVAAYENLGRLRNRSLFGPWVLKITRCQAVRMAQRRAAARRFEAVHDPPVSADAVERDETLQHLLAALGRLPAHERVVVIFHYLEGHRVQTIAQMTGRPLGTVTKQLSRAIRRLRQSLAEIER